MENKKDLTISLIIPAHNEEKYISRCLDHVFKNSSGAFNEIIVVDNVSTDKTAQIAQGYPGVRVVEEKNKGTSAARQRGFLESRGEILAFIDADTAMPPGWSEVILKEFSKNKKLACMSGPFRFDGISMFSQHFLNLFYFFIAPPLTLVTGGNFAIRRSVLEKMGGFDVSIKFYGDDSNINKRAKKIGKVKFNSELLMYSSGRRFVKQGFPKVCFVYVLNFLSETLFSRTATKKAKDVR